MRAWAFGKLGFMECGKVRTGILGYAQPKLRGMGCIFFTGYVIQNTFCYLPLPSPFAHAR